MCVSICLLISAFVNLINRDIHIIDQSSQQKCDVCRRHLNIVLFKSYLCSTFFFILSLFLCIYWMYVSGDWLVSFNIYFVKKKRIENQSHLKWSGIWFEILNNHATLRINILSPRAIHLGVFMKKKIPSCDACFDK